MDARSYQPATLAAQALGIIDEATRAIVPPVHTATTYLRDPDNQYRSGYSYGRDDNPTVRAVEALLTRLEAGAAARLFSSGMAAAAALFQALEPGAHVVAPTVMYWGLRKWLRSMASAGRLELDFVPGDDLEALRAALRPGQTRLVWIETPANPLWTVTDIAAASELAHAAGAFVAVDGTVATPVLTRPLELGADLVMHSATKYLNGHSDVMAGVLVTAREDGLWERICESRAELGAILGGFEAWLLLRGLRTLVLRVRSSSEGAMAVARHFQGHPAVVETLYPGLPAHPGHATAARQMEGGFGGMLSIRVRGGEGAAIATAAAVQLFKRATSLGGVESLIEHRASVEGPDSPVPSDLLRLSIGVEDPRDLIDDLEQALEHAQPSESR